MKRALIILILPLAYLAFVGKIASYYVADLYAESSKYYLKEGEIKLALDRANKAVAANKNEPAYLRQKAKTLLAQKVLAPEDEQIALNTEVLETLQVAEKLNPHNLATTRNIIPLYYLLSPGTDTPKDFYMKMKGTYSNDLGVLVDVATYEGRLGLTDEYAATKEMAKELRPEILEWNNAF